MKKIVPVTTFLFLCVFMNAQVPQGINYQAVARTADGVIIPTQNIGVRFSILDGSATGAVLYSETHTVITNSYGLFTLAIGKGTPVTSTFAGFTNIVLASFCISGGIVVEKNSVCFLTGSFDITFFTS